MKEATTLQKPAPVNRRSARNRLKTIAVATDFSSNAMQALQWAAALGVAHESRIVLIHARPETPSPTDIADAVAHDRVHENLDAALSVVGSAKLAGSTRSEVGRPWEVIARLAAESEADLVVIGTRGHGAYTRLMLGSTADRLIRMSPVPVLCIHPGDDPPADALNTILVPMDFSEESSLGLSMAVRLLNASGGGHIVLLHAVELLVDWPAPELPTLLPRAWDDAEARARHQLETIAAPLRGGLVKVTVKTFRGYAADAIEEETRRSGADMIIMGTRGLGGLDRLLIGSVAERVIHHVKCPVLTVKRPDPTTPIRMSEE